MGGSQPGPWISRARGTLKCWSFFLSLFLHFSAFSWEPLLLPPSSSILLRGAPGTRSTRCPPPPPPPPPAPSACLPSLLPGGPGQCCRRSRDLQEICLSEKQLVWLSTANVCMLRPPLPPRSMVPVPDRAGAPLTNLRLSIVFFHLEPSSCSNSPSDDLVLSDFISAVMS